MARRRSLAALPLAVAAVLVPAVAADASTNTIYTVAGIGGGPGFSGDNGPATAAQLAQPQTIAPTAGGGFLIAESLGNRIRRVSALGIITTVVGDGSSNFSGDNGPATAAQVSAPSGVASTADGGFLIADSGNHRIRRVTPAGQISTVAGNGTASSTGDNGPATAATINNPQRVNVTPDGGYLIAEGTGDRIRRVSPGGTISTAAGDGTNTSGGDGGPATAAGVNGPKDVVPTPDGGFLITQQQAHRIRRVSPGGTITTAVGDGTSGTTGDGGPAVSALVSFPTGITVTPDGGFVFAEFGGRVRRVTPGGTITMLAGGGATSPGDGGPATLAQLGTPLGVAITAEGRVLVAEFNGNRIRFVDTDTRPAPPGATGPAGQGQAGPQGPAGPAGAPGATGAVRLAAALADDRFKARRSRTLRLRYVVTRSARVTLDVVKGRKRVSRKSVSAAAGRNRVGLKAPQQAGRYTLRFAARSSDGQATTDSARLTVTR